MSRFFARLALITLSALLAWPLTIAHAQSPEIRIEEMLHDLGEVFQRDSYAHGFKVKNNGDADLVITKVKPSCGCTVAEYDEVIAPGKTGLVHLEIIDEKIDSGAFNKKATIHTNDPQHPTMTIALAGHILQHVEVAPGEKVYLRGMYGERVAKELTIRSHEKRGDFQITGLRSNIDDKITYAAVPAAEPGVYTIRLWKNPKAPTMNTWGSLTIASNSEYVPERVVQVNVNTRGAIITQPTSINFGMVDEDMVTGEETVSKATTVFKIKGEFRIREARFSSSYYAADIEPIEDGKKYKVTVTFSPSAMKMSYIDEMILRTDDPHEPTVRVRLVARGR